MNDSLLHPEKHVLSTLEEDGSRRWLKPKLSKGRFLRRRRVVAYGLILIFTLLPFVKIGGKPFILLDIPAREFTIFGYTFLPTDTVLLALFMVGLLLSVFFVTALVGRVWCGWACPQTVYLEFVFRPVERLLDGLTGRGGTPKSGPQGGRVAMKYAVYLVICFYLANTFLAYFVGVETLGKWMTQSPWHHPAPFLVMASVTGLMMFDFCFFREQLCIIACPYGRFQSVLLDQDSLIVSYDSKRGEPRGRMRKRAAAAPPATGDCVDCRLCVTTCPTGIDIRDGLQMECVNCTQCIDACDAVMTRLGRPRGLIRYSSQAAMAGNKPGLLRPRVIIYPLILALIATLMIITLGSKKSFDAVVLREPGNPYTVQEDGRVRNLLRIKLTNRTDQPMTLELAAENAPGVSLEISEKALQLAPRQTETFHVGATAPPDQFQAGRIPLRIQVRNEQGQQRSVKTMLLGPRHRTSKR